MFLSLVIVCLSIGRVVNGLCVGVCPDQFDLAVGDDHCPGGGTLFRCGGNTKTVCNGLQGEPGPVFHVEFIGTVSDAYFVAANNPLLVAWCGTDANPTQNITFNTVVTADVRINRNTPLFRRGTLNGAPVPVTDLTRFVVVYFCKQKQWGALANFLGMPGPAPNVTTDDKGCIVISGNGQGVLCPQLGAQGIQGEQGTQGIQGEQGPAGPVGPQGVQGIQGIQGVQGLPGATGGQGPMGDIGLTGSQGPPGSPPTVTQSGANCALITGTGSRTICNGTSVTVSGGTNNGIAYVISDGAAVSSTAALTNGQLVIGSTGSAPVAATLTGTMNQVNVATGSGSIALSTPQNIHSGATPTFSTLSLTSNTNELVLGTTNTLTITLGTFSGSRTYTLVDTGVADSFTMASQTRKRMTMWHDEALVTQGTAIAYVNEGQQPFNGYWQQSTPAINNTFTHSFSCQAGTYTLFLLCHTQNSNGIVTWTVDGVGPGVTMDLYSGTQVNNVVLSTSLGSLTNGYHKLQGRLATKNPSSSNFGATITKYWIAPTSD